MKKIILWASLIVIASCKSRKVEFQETREKVDSLSVIFRGVDLNKIQKDWIFIPTVLDKPIIIKGDTVYNARIEYRDRIIDSVVRQIDTVYVSRDVESNDRSVESQSDWKWIKKSLPWLGIIALIVGAIYFSWRYFPKKNIS